MRQTALVGLSSVAGRQTPSQANLAAQTAGLRRRPIDQELTRMAEEAYSDGREAGKCATELAAQGWARMKPEGDRMVAPDGVSLPIEPGELDDKRSGFQAAIWHRPLEQSPGQPNQFVVAYAGTNTKQPGDIKAAVGQGLGLDEQQYEQSTALQHKMRSASLINSKDVVGLLLMNRP